ncbi:hypothetical protein B0H67DRAFT_479320 [Lasiosphaeris hirsuta]|uniref:Uncharacterized protein n=1 Tax=Lasiosphaeris hirsuta TaxID=260670 RepID=A0AA40B9W9_9PEZI|nr:hypothetical protein B0H67DRAFT_479320 [Lasiosphaeris hirsuta]
MFEQKGETSPPDRGRSPGIPPSKLESPRPLSKVRTNFIAIEKDGRIAQDPNSEVPTGASRRFNRTGADVAAENSVVSGGGSTSTTEAEPVNGTTNGKEKEKANGKEVAKPTAARTTARAPPKPLAVPTASKPTAKPAKSPTVSKAPKSPATTSTPNLPAKTPDRNARQPEKTETPKAAASSARASIKRPPPLQPSPSSTGFIKPKPKSPTRPVRLPAGLTTHTAASGSKVNAPRQSLSRTSGVIQTIDSMARSPSRASVSTTTTSTTKPTGAKSLKRQNSTINRPRPSLGPPPKQPAKDYPPTRKEKEVDESFLARMMRPTQASSSKTTEKLPITPPRKPSLSPATRRPSAPVSAPAELVAPVVGLAEEIISPAAGAEETTAEEVAPVVEQVATAEEAIQVAKEIEGEIAIPEPPIAEVDVETTPHDVEELVAVVRKLSLEDVAIGSEVVNGHHDQGKEMAVNGEVNGGGPVKATDSDVSSDT